MFLTYFQNLSSFHLSVGTQKDLKLVDAPVSGGFKKAAEGALTVHIQSSFINFSFIVSFLFCHILV